MTFWEIVTCPHCRRRLWKRGCRTCGGWRRIAVPAVRRSTESTLTGDVYSSRRAAEAAIRRR